MQSNGYGVTSASANCLIADFACIEKRLIIEIDGGQHNPTVDSSRNAWFERHVARLALLEQ